MRIWRTVSGNTNKNDIPEAVKWLFGSTDYAGRLKVSDFVAERRRAPKQVEMVAIDRFTGGASHGAKFSVLAHESPCLTGNLSIDDFEVSTETRDQALGLLVLLLRDLDEGDIPLGFGTRKGFGAGRLAGDNAFAGVLRSIFQRSAADEGWRSETERVVAAFRAAHFVEAE